MSCTACVIVAVVAALGGLPVRLPERFEEEVNLLENRIVDAPDELVRRIGFGGVPDPDVGAANRNLSEEVRGADERIVDLLGLQPAHELPREVGRVVAFHSPGNCDES